MNRTAVVLAGVALAVLAVLGSASTPTALAAQTEHRAAVIVDTGDTVKRVCVRFTEESITGKEALERAGVDPVFYGMGGRGAAVCALCGTGCEAGDSCLTCDPDGRYWAYWRDDDGGGYEYSNAGVSNTIVTDGDVEGWKWGTGQAPPGAIVAEVCGEEPAPAPAPAEPESSTPASPTVDGPPSGGGGEVAGPFTSDDGPPVGAPTPTTAAVPSPTSVAGDAPPDASTTTAAEPDDAAPTGTDDDEALAASPVSDDRDAGGGERGTATSLVGFAIALAVITGLTVRARRARRHPAGDG